MKIITRNPIPSLPRILACAAVIALACVARGHSVWIEDTPDKKLVVRFGEFGAEIEKSPGHLDELTAVAAWTHGADGKPILFEAPKKNDHFLISSAALTNAVQIETGYEVMSSTNGASRKPFFYARWHPKGAGKGTPALMLDLVPTGKTGEVRVYFRGKPVAGAKLLLIVPDDDEKELTADAEGFVRFTADKPGLYHLSYSHHRETLDGFAGGRAYNIVSHNAALTWRQ